MPDSENLRNERLIVQWRPHVLDVVLPLGKLELGLVQEAALALDMLTGEQFDEWVDPSKMIGPKS